MAERQQSSHGTYMKDASDMVICMEKLPEREYDCGKISNSLKDGLTQAPVHQYHDNVSRGVHCSTIITGRSGDEGKKSQRFLSKPKKLHLDAVEDREGLQSLRHSDEVPQGPIEYIIGWDIMDESHEYDKIHHSFNQVRACTGFLDLEITSRCLMNILFTNR